MQIRIQNRYATTDQVGFALINKGLDNSIKKGVHSEMRIQERIQGGIDKW